MTIPKKLKILGMTYEVRSTVPDEGNLLANSRDCAGSVTVNKALILINKDNHIDQQRDTLLHESLHAIDYQMSIGLTEEQVQRVASSLMCLMKDNPKLMDYLLAD